MQLNLGLCNANLEFLVWQDKLGLIIMILATHLSTDAPSYRAIFYRAIFYHHITLHYWWPQEVPWQNIRSDCMDDNQKRALP